MPAKRVARKNGKTKKAPGKGGKPPGRPSVRTDELVEAFLALVTEGKGLRVICELPEMPTMSTICLWLTNDEEFSERYARAKEVAAILMSEEILEIADNIGHEAKDTIQTKFGEIPNKEWVQRSKLRVDARLTLMEKLYPKKYGPRLDQKISGKLKTKNTHEISPELQEAIMAKSAEAAVIAATVQPPASFRGQGGEE